MSEAEILARVKELSPPDRSDLSEVAKTLEIAPSMTLKLAFLESCLNVEWWRGYRAGANAVLGELDMKRKQDKGVAAMMVKDG